MSASARFALHRPEFLDALVRGEDKIAELTKASSMTFAAGASVIVANTDHRFVYRLLQGWACRSRQLADGRNQFILIFLPGDLFAVKSMFVTRHTDAVLAVSRIVVERIHYRDLHAAYVADSDIATRCIWQVMEEERRLHSWVVGLGQGSAEERLALLLLDFRGRLAQTGAIGPTSLAYNMPLTQAQLADHLGITAVHVNRVLKSFRECGMVTIRDGQVVITDIDALAQCASPLLDAHDRVTPECEGAQQT
ncbi:MAG: Crp/Fnr family transcriptional regulator [Gammaproteobacteria bacterium]|nr:Crp/Fnr family transcriptional regulator [Gammaproteobacteria bacterium]